jgi:hypothetical protein
MTFHHDGTSVIITDCTTASVPPTPLASDPDPEQDTDDKDLSAAGRVKRSDHVTNTDYTVSGSKDIIGDAIDMASHVPAVEYISRQHQVQYSTPDPGTDPGHKDLTTAGGGHHCAELIPKSHTGDDGITGHRNMENETEHAAEASSTTRCRGPEKGSCLKHEPPDGNRAVANGIIYTQGVSTVPTFTPDTVQSSMLTACDEKSIRNEYKCRRVPRLNAPLEQVIPTYPEAGSLHADLHSASSVYGDNPSLDPSSREYTPALYVKSPSGPDTASQPENTVFCGHKVFLNNVAGKIHLNGMKVDGYLLDICTQDLESGIYSIVPEVPQNDEKTPSGRHGISGQNHDLNYPKDENFTVRPNVTILHDDIQEALPRPTYVIIDEKQRDPISPEPKIDSASYHGGYLQQRKADWEWLNRQHTYDKGSKSHVTTPSPLPEGARPSPVSYQDDKRKRSPDPHEVRDVSYHGTTAASGHIQKRSTAASTPKEPDSISVGLHSGHKALHGKLDIIEVTAGIPKGPCAERVHPVNPERVHTSRSEGVIIKDPGKQYSCYSPVQNSVAHDTVMLTDLTEDSVGHQDVTTPCYHVEGVSQHASSTDSNVNGDSIIRMDFSLGDLHIRMDADASKTLNLIEKLEDSEYDSESELMDTGKGPNPKGQHRQHRQHLLQCNAQCNQSAPHIATSSKTGSTTRWRSHHRLCGASASF